MNLDLTNIAALQNTSLVNSFQAPGAENTNVQNPDAQVPSFEAMLASQNVEQHEPQLLSIEKSTEASLSPAPTLSVVLSEEIALDGSFASPLLEAFQVAQNSDVKPNLNPGPFLVRPPADFAMPITPISPPAPKLIDDASILSLSEFDDVPSALFQAPPVDEQTFEQYWMDDDEIVEQMIVQYNFDTKQFAEESDPNIPVLQAIPVLNESEFKPLPFDKASLAVDTKQQEPEEVATEIPPTAFGAETEVNQEVKNKQLVAGIKTEITRMPSNQQIALQLPSDRTLNSLGTSLSLTNIKEPLQGAEIAFNQPHKSLQNDAVVALSGGNGSAQALNTEGEEFASEIAKSLSVKLEGEFKVVAGQKEVLSNIPEQEAINIPKAVEYREISAIEGEISESEFDNALPLDIDVLEGGVVKSVAQDSAKLYSAKFESNVPKLVEAKQIIAEKIIQGVKQQATQLEFTIADPDIGKVKISFEYVPNSATQEVAAIKIEAERFSTLDDLTRAKLGLESIVKSNVNVAKDCELSFLLKDFSTSTSSNQEFKHNFKGNESYTSEQFENYVGQEIIEQRILPYMTVNSIHSNVGGVSIFA